MPENNFIEYAIKLSEENIESGGGPFGAIVVKNNSIVGIGTNQVTQLNDPTAHAEIIAIRDACKNLETFDLSGTEIYSSCEPCPMCLSAIYWARIERIFFANDKNDAAEAGFRDDFIYNEIPKPFAVRSIPTQHIFKEHAKHAFNLWIQKNDKVNY